MVLRKTGLPHPGNCEAVLLGRPCYFYLIVHQFALQVNVIRLPPEGRVRRSREVNLTPLLSLSAGHDAEGKFDPLKFHSLTRIAAIDKIMGSLALSMERGLRSRYSMVFTENKNALFPIVLATDSFIHSATHLLSHLILVDGLCLLENALVPGGH